MIIRSPTLARAPLGGLPIRTVSRKTTAFLPRKEKMRMIPDRLHERLFHRELFATSRQTGHVFAFDGCRTTKSR
jgi:hypothetical protein